MRRNLSSFGTLLFGSLLLTAATARADTILIDFGKTAYQSPAATANNMTDTHTANGGTISNLKTQAGATTNYTLTMTKPLYWEANANGTTTPAAALGLPASATRDSFVGHTVRWETTDPHPDTTFILRNLNPAVAYSLNFFASRMWVNDNREAEFAVSGANSQSAFVNASANTANSSTTAGIYPTPAGEISILMKKGPNNNNQHGFFYLGALKITYNPAPIPSPTPSPTPSPVPPANPVVSNYSLKNLASSIELRAELNQPGKVYYAVYLGDSAPMTAAQVKSAASQAVGAQLKARGVVTTGGVSDISIPNLADKARYSVFAIAENSVGQLGTDAQVKRYVGVLPKKISQQNYNTAIAGKSSIVIRYLVTYPAGYYDQPDARFPVLMYVHGGGETFTNTNNAESYFTTNATSRMDHTPLHARIALGQEVPFIAIAPQCNASYFTCANGEETRFYAEVIDRVNGTYRTNPKRYYVAGMSWGGSGTWKLGYDYPQKVTAIAPISGAFYRTLSGICSRFAANGVPVWAFANVADPYFPYTSSRDAINTLKNCSGAPDARFTSFNGQTYPATIHPHNTVEYVMNAPYKNYQATPPSLTNYSIPLAPEFVSGLATAQAELRTRFGDPNLSIDDLYKWFMLWSKP